MNHLAAIESGEVTRTTVIGLRKAINADSRRRAGYSVSCVAPKLQGRELETVLLALERRKPVVTDTALHESGLARLRSKRYAKRLAPVADIIARIERFRLVGYLTPEEIDFNENVTPLYRAETADGEGFTFYNLAWQSGGDGPRVVEG